ncbi:HEPN domain-containing protein [Vibrio vulnificus]|nr:HEPN domain-containing protein [Vibrio vulnificus]
MKFRSIKHWGDSAGLESLAFFAQLMEELLFEFSLDTYKPSALNASLLCDEILSLINDIENGLIKKQNLKHVVDEFVENLKKDEVAKGLISLDLGIIYKKLNENHSDTTEVKDIINVIVNQISLSRYKKACEKKLVNLMGQPLDCGEIRTVARNYVTTLLNSGFSSEFIYLQAKSFFYDRDKPISSNDDIGRFIAIFNNEPTKYEVLFRADKIFNEIQDSCKKLGIEILKDAPFNVENERAMEIKNSSDVYLHVKDIEARDHFKAKKYARFSVDILRTTLNLFHHKEDPSYLDFCLIREFETEKVHRVGSNTNQMHKCNDLKPSLASKKLQDFLSNFSLDKSSFSQFIRSSELHAQALKTDSEENQIINLWIAIESLIPPKSSDADTIDHIINSVMPFLNLSYVHRVFRNFAKDLLNWNSALVSDLFNGIEANSLPEKVILLLTQDNYQEKRNLLEANFRDFHLIKDRYFHLQGMVENPNTLYKILQSHKKRLDWQIRRIYRTRNMIVHSGKKPDNLGILITNTHDYLDIILSGIIELAKNEAGAYSIRECFKYSSIKYDKYLSDLGKKNAKFERENISQMTCPKLI